MYKMFYNSKDINDCLYIVFDDEKFPDEVKKNGNVVTLYKEGKLIGINLFEFSKIYNKDNIGCLVYVDDSILDKINEELVAAGLDKLEPLKESGYKIFEVTRVIEHPLDEKLSVVYLTNKTETKYQSITRYKNLEVGTKVVGVIDGTLKLDGSVYHKYVSHNIESNVELTSAKDLGLGDNFKEAYLPTEKETGEDFFF